MKHTKVILAVMVIVALIATTGLIAVAKRGGGQGQGYATNDGIGGAGQAIGRSGGQPAQRLANMKQVLNLSDEQVAQIKTIVENEREEIKNIRSNDSLDLTAKREAMHNVRVDTRNQINGVLTTEQQKTWEEYPAVRHLQRLTYVLSLTEEQQGQIEPVLVNANSARRQIADNNALSFEERRTQMDQLRETTNATIMNYLDEDQQAKFEKMTANRGPGRPGGPGGPGMGQDCPNNGQGPGANKAGKGGPGGQGRGQNK